MNEKKQRKMLFANQVQKDVLLLVAIASLVPTMLVTVLLYYLIFGITANEAGMPETIAYTIVPAAQKVLNVLVVATPLVIAVILFIAFKVTHRILGPFDRIVREVGKRAAGTAHGRIALRKDDKFWPLVENINKLIEKAEKK